MSDETIGGPLVEVLVVSYASAAAIVPLLDSLLATMPGTPIAFREHGDPDAYRELVETVTRYAGPTRHEHDPTNPGFGAGCNALASGSRARWLLFLNPDTEVLAWPWVTDAPPVGAIVGPLMVGSGNPADHWGRSYRVRDEIAWSWLRRRGARPRGRGFVSGAALLVEAARFEQLGGFDEAYFLFYEDIDLCRRANRTGIATIVDDRWLVRHRRAHSTRVVFARSLVWSYESACRYHGRNGSNVRGYRAYVIADAVARCAVRMLRLDPTAARAYAALAFRATRDVVSG